MEFDQFLKLYGPLGLGWPIAAFLLRYVLKLHEEHSKEKSAMVEKQLDYQVKVAVALENFTQVIRAYFIK